MKLESLREKSTLTIKKLKDLLNQLGEEYDNLPVFVNQADSHGNSCGQVAVLVSVYDDPEDEYASLEIETSEFGDSFEESEEGLTPKMVFEAHLKDSEGKISDIIPELGYANLNYDEQKIVDLMIDKHNSCNF